MKVYIAGKITGDPNYHEKFNIGRKALEYEGHIVLNPAVLPEGMNPADYMRVCFAMIDIADAVAFLPDWYYSRGARLENDYCQYTGKVTMYLKSMTAYKNLKEKITTMKLPGYMHKLTPAEREVYLHGKWNYEEEPKND